MQTLMKMPDKHSKPLNKLLNLPSMLLRMQLMKPNSSSNSSRMNKKLTSKHSMKERRKRRESKERVERLYSMRSSKNKQMLKLPLMIRPLRSLELKQKCKKPLMTVLNNQSKMKSKVDLILPMVIKLPWKVKRPPLTINFCQSKLLGMALKLLESKMKLRN